MKTEAAWYSSHMLLTLVTSQPLSVGPPYLDAFYMLTIRDPWHFWMTCERDGRTGIESDGVLAPWVPSDLNVLIYGDSITEGVLTLGGSQHFDTDHNDACKSIYPLGNRYSAREH